jgi:hypothetical protein
MIDIRTRTIRQKTSSAASYGSVKTKDVERQPVNLIDGICGLLLQHAQIDAAGLTTGFAVEGVSHRSRKTTACSSPMRRPYLPQNGGEQSNKYRLSSVC